MTLTNTFVVFLGLILRDFSVLSDSNFGSNAFKKPNIVVIMADDMGSHDMSFTSMKQFYTPNIDALAAHGTILNHHYTPNLCTPSRAAFLTGKEPMNIGMQHFVIPNEEPWGLPLKEVLMPQIFQQNGYKTHLVGKWHLGFYKKDYTPLRRGFDSHFGYYGGYISYYTHSANCLALKGCNLGVDFRSQYQTNFSVNGKYATDLFTEEAVRRIENHNTRDGLFLIISHLAAHTGSETTPMEAPQEDIDKFKYIKDENRRIYAAMVHKLDKSVGEVFQALKRRGILDNTIVLFYSDNGAPTKGVFANSGSNYPLRGQKESPWEGGIRSTAIVWSKHIKKPGNVLSQVASVTDWFPTFLSAANIPYNHKLLDGVNLWRHIIGANETLFRRRLTHCLDEIFGYTSILDSMWKYVNGTRLDGQYDTWLGEIGDETDSTLDYSSLVKNSNVGQVLGKYNTLTMEKLDKIQRKLRLNCPSKTIIECKPLEKPCLFNISLDPCERVNLADTYPNIMKYFERLVAYEKWKAVPSARVPFADPNSNPTLHNNTWSFWGEDIDSIKE